MFPTSWNAGMTFPFCWKAGATFSLLSGRKLDVFSILWNAGLTFRLLSELLDRRYHYFLERKADVYSFCLKAELMFFYFLGLRYSAVILDT